MIGTLGNLFGTADSQGYNFYFETGSHEDGEIALAVNERVYCLFLGLPRSLLIFA